MKKLGHWYVTKDSKNSVTNGRHFVAKLEFDKEGSGLSLSVEEQFRNCYMIELAIEVNNSVDSCFRIENSVTEEEALEIVADLVDTI